MSDTLRAAAQALRDELDGRVAVIKSLPVMEEVLKVHAALNALEAIMGEPLTTLTALFGMDAESSVVIRADEFYGLGPLEAAKRYLKKRGEARPFTEIVEAIQAGGGRVDSPEDLRLSLSRSTYEVAKVGDDLYGLVEFYPHLKRERSKKKRPGMNEETDAEIEREQMDGQIARDVAFLAETDNEGKK
jgi:hypothetical protein